ncbi:MAG: ArsR/SmtB family transcription factor [Bacteroidia bacterium]
MMKVIGHPSRLAIVDLLLEKGRLPVGDITDMIEISQSSTSQHLKALERVGALESEREGTFIFYTIKNPTISMLVDCVNQCADC